MEDRFETSPIEEKQFKLDLNNAPPEVQDRYHKLLLGIRAENATKHPGPPKEISIDERENLLHKAKTASDYEEAKKLLQMERDWEAASKGGRPPIGGAIDD